MTDPAPVTHVVGAGMSGLSCALRLVLAGRRVALYDAAGHAGGRCRSFHDDTLDCEIDNGNHLLLSGNSAAMAFLDAVGARDTLLSPPRAVFPFVDLATGERWTVRPGPGRLPFWLLDASRRVAGSRPAEYLAALRLARAGDRTVAECFDTARPIYRRFWEPFAVAVLNTAADEAAASLLWPVIVETFGRGEAATRPCIARNGLSRSFVDPALGVLRERGAAVHLNRRLRAVDRNDGRVASLDFGGEKSVLDPRDVVVLAVPPSVAASLLPGLSTPQASRPIVNAHFRLANLPDMARAGGSCLTFLGVVGGTAQWLFLRGSIVSVTVSAAQNLADMDAGEIARRLWDDVARALELPAAPRPPCRVVKEKRATFAQTPAELRRRPGTRTAWRNLFLAGDWTDTGLPATIEGAMRSGERAAAAVVGEPIRDPRNSVAGIGE